MATAKTKKTTTIRDAAKRAKKKAPRMSEQLHNASMGVVGELVGGGLLAFMESAAVELRRFVRAQEAQAAALARVVEILERMEKRELGGASTEESAS